MNNQLFTPDSKIKSSMPRQPTKPRMQIRQLNLTSITERNIIFNQMITEASNNYNNIIATPNSNASVEPRCPDAPRKKKSYVLGDEIIAPRNLLIDF